MVRPGCRLGQYFLGQLLGMGPQGDLGAHYDAGIRFHLARRRAETFPEPRLLPWLYNFRLRLRPCHLLWREPPAGRHALLYVAAGRSLQPGSGRD